MSGFFNVEAIEKLRNTAQLAPQGFRFGYTDNIFKADIYENLIATFPPIEQFKLVDKQSGGGHKKFYVGPVYLSSRYQGCVCHFDKTLSPLWQKVMEELASTEFKEALQWATGIEFNSLCDFGFAYGNEGCQQGPHLDGAVRPDDKSGARPVIACLLYLNRKPGGSTGTCIYDIDRETLLFQAPNLNNSLFFFEQHPASWHGFPIVPCGEDRRVVSLSYSLENQPINLKKSFFHKIVCFNKARSLLQF